MQRRTNNKKTVSFRLDADAVAHFDELAKSQARDRTSLLSEALKAYLETQLWQIGHIQEGIRRADSGTGTPHERVVARWRRRLR